jgi:hypothetical protein
VEKCILYSQLRDLTIFFVQDQNFSKIRKPTKKFATCIDFNIEVVWNYFASSHGKGPFGGIGGTVKRLAAKASLHHTHTTFFNRPP